MQVTDTDLNSSASTTETTSVSVTSGTEGLTGISETVALTETGTNTGVFRGSIQLNLGGAAAMDGILAIALGDVVTVSYQDASNSWGNAATFSHSASIFGTVVEEVTENSTWVLTGSPYLVVGKVTVPSDVSLTIDPGVRVLFLSDDEHYLGNDGSQLYIYGTLTAESGGGLNPIVFTSSAASPQAGDWMGLKIHGGTVSLKYCEINSAAQGVEVSEVDGNITVEHCTISGNSSYGIKIRHGSAVIANSSISNNTRSGIWAEESGVVTVTGSTITGNAGGVLVRYAQNTITIANTIITHNYCAGISSCYSPAGIRYTFAQALSSLIVSGSTISNNGEGVRVISPPEQRGATMPKMFTITQNTISNNLYGGVEYTNNHHPYSSLPTITYNTIVNNGTSNTISGLDGVRLMGDYAFATINYNNLYGNTGEEIDSQVTIQEINAQYNYWGPTTTALMAAGSNPKDIPSIRDYYDYSSASLVNYTNWLTEPYSP